MDGHSLMKHKQVRIFGIPMDLGQSRRGVDMGPSAIRYAQLHEKLRSLGYDTIDEGNIHVALAEQTPALARVYPNARFLPQVARICQATFESINDCWRPDEFGLFLGGDHSLSIGTIAAVAQRGKTGVVWVDAHTDMNAPESSPSGNIHGMSLASLLGDGPAELVNVGFDGAKLSPHQVIVIGAHDVEPAERLRVKQSGIAVYTMRDVDERGMASLVREILNKFSQLDAIHVSFDLDSCDPGIAGGVGTPVSGGFTFREIHLLMESLADSGKVCSMDVVECNPILDEHNRTAVLAVEMIASLLGKRIL